MSSSIGTEWPSSSSESKTTPTVPPSLPKLPLAQYRYGREEMLLFYSDQVPYPEEMALIATLARKETIPPLAISPLSPQEQSVLSGRVNSDSYSVRGRGAYPRGRGGRGRGGRPDYYRNPSSGGDDRNSYYRSNSESDKNEEIRYTGVGGAGGGDRGSRASQDTNWRQPTQQKEQAWVGKPWSSVSSPVKPKVGGAWEQGDGGGGAGRGRRHWQAVPDWATDNKQDTAVEQSELPDEDGKKEEQDLNEDVFESVTESNSIAENETTPTKKAEHAMSSDSVEEMERRFEKVAEAIISTEDEETPSQSPNPSHYLSPLATNANTDQWYYQDPQGDTQGPFTNKEMCNWYQAGYFTLSLNVRRSCDMMMLPLGQVIRIWGRNPFVSGPHPPPLQHSEPYWQQVLMNQHQLFPEPPSKPHPQPHPQPQEFETSPIWGVLPKDMVVKETVTKETTAAAEDQWPDLGTVKQNEEEEEMRQRAMKEQRRREEEEEEERKRMREYELEQQRLREEEEKRRRRQEEERRRLEDEKRRKEEEKRRQEEERRRQEEERRRQEEEAAAALAERKRKEEELKRDEEKRRKIREERLLQEEKRQLAEEREESTPTVPRPSLLDIQREEEIAHQQEIQTRKQQHQLIDKQQRQEQELLRSTQCWNKKPSINTNVKTQSSFAAIQQEQKQLEAATADNGGGGVTAAHSSSHKPMTSIGTSWSKITAGNKPQTPPAPWGSNHTPNQATAPVFPPPTNSTASSSFWEECALDTVREKKTSGNEGKGRGRERQVPSGGGSVGGAINRSNSKEEDKVRKLFTASAPDEAFTQWCKKELDKYDSDVDAVTFVNFLLEVESSYEVHDYIKSFLGETDEVHSFAKEFLEKRQKIVNYKQTTAKGQQVKKSSAAAGGDSTGGGGSTRSSKKKKKGGGGGGSGKMQKVSPSSLLGFTVNAAERPNAGEIQSAKDAM